MAAGGGCLTGRPGVNRRGGIAASGKPVMPLTAITMGASGASGSVASGDAGAGLLGDAEAMDVRCLIVDDNNQFLRLAREVLEQEGIVVAGIASDGAEALRQIERLSPDVTLIDVDLGEESGFELVEEIARSGLAEHTTTILVSAYVEDDFADLIMPEASVAFLPKHDLSGGAIREILRGNRTVT